jgi:hypothetical protein
VEGVGLTITEEIEMGMAGAEENLPKNLARGIRRAIRGRITMTKVMRKVIRETLPKISPVRINLASLVTQVNLEMMMEP